MICQKFPQTPEDTRAELDRAQRIVDEAFPCFGTPRSPEYKAGCLAILQYLLAGRPVLCKYDTGTAEHDAFYAGVDAGKKIYCHTEER